MTNFSLKGTATAMLLASGIISSSAAAQSVLEGYRAHQRGDFASAVRNLRPFAENGDVSAAFLLGGLYYEGRGVAANPREAVRLWHQAANKGDTGSQYSLGLAYAGGRGVPQDFVQAHMWFNLAAAGTEGVDQGMTQKVRDLREGIAKSMTLAQVAEAQRLAREWRPEKR